MAIHSRKLSHRITVERPTAVLDAYGHRVPGWEIVAMAWAAVRPMGSNERVAAAQMQSAQTHVVTTRYSPALAALKGECRMRFDSRSFNLVGLPRNIDEADKYLIFDCVEGGADGH